ncbi:MAG: DUF211 domain-containing protein [Candidatus Micrarchaeota archaeon]
MAGIKRLVLDVLIPINFPTPDLTKRIALIKGIEAVDVLIQEVERKVETAKITIEGEDLDFEKIRELIESTGSSLQSIDRVTCGKRLTG